MKKPVKESLSLELDGKINLVSRKGRKITREEIDGKICLEIIIQALMSGIEQLKCNLNTKSRHDKG